MMHSTLSTFHPGTPVLTVFLLTTVLLLTTGSFTPASAGEDRLSEDRMSEGPPASWASELGKADPAPSADLPRIDREPLLREDAVRDAADLPYRFALPVELSLSSDRDGRWQTIERRTPREALAIWRLRLRGEDDVSLHLRLPRLALPPSARLDIYAADRSLRLGPWTAADVPRGYLSTAPVATDDLMIEVSVAASEADQVRVEVAQLFRGYRGFDEPAGSPFDKSGACNVDVVCPEGDAWDPQIRSVARIIFGGFTCTGVAINNTANDLRPLFLTAAHCISSQPTAETTVVIWKFENSTCRTPGGGASGGPGDGSTALSQSGTDLLFTSSPSDITLLEMHADPPDTAEVYFAGWNVTSADASAAIAVHHPSGDEKRISFEDDPVTTTTYLGSSSPGNGTHVRVEDWDLGTTEGGSSGSPLFDPEGLIIGQLHGGFAACGNDLADWYGRMSVSHAAGAAAILDPGATGAMTWEGLDTLGGIFADGFESGDTMAWSATIN